MDLSKNLLQKHELFFSSSIYKKITAPFLLVTLLFAATDIRLNLFTETSLMHFSETRRNRHRNTFIHHAGVLWINLYHSTFNQFAPETYQPSFAPFEIDILNYHITTQPIPDQIIDIPEILYRPVKATVRRFPFPSLIPDNIPGNVQIHSIDCQISPLLLGLAKHASHMSFSTYPIEMETVIPRNRITCLMDQFSFKDMQFINFGAVDRIQDREFIIERV